MGYFEQKKKQLQVDFRLICLSAFLMGGQYFIFFALNQSVVDFNKNHLSAIRKNGVAFRFVEIIDFPPF